MLYIKCVVFQSVKMAAGAWLVLNHVPTVRTEQSVTSRMEHVCVHQAILETSVKLVGVGTAVIYLVTALRLCIILLYCILCHQQLDVWINNLFLWQFFHCVPCSLPKWLVWSWLPVSVPL